MVAVEIDINDFINEANDAVPSADRVMVPESEYPMYIKPGTIKLFDGESDKGKWRLFTATTVIDDPNARDATNLENPTARMRFFLDVNPTGSLAVGANRNTRLGALLRATGKDHAGWTYGELEGVNFKGRVKHIADKKDSSRIDAEVVAVTKL